MVLQTRGVAGKLLRELKVGCQQQTLKNVADGVMGGIAGFLTGGAVVEEAERKSEQTDL